MNNIVIFGGSGFIGTHLAESLLSLETNKVIVVDLQVPRIRHERLVYVKGDVRDLSNLKVGGEVVRIYNLAAVHTTPGHPSHEYYETNVSGANAVCAFAEDNDVHEIIFTSSISVYGPGEDQKDESSSLAPASAYGYSKMLSEKIHNSWCERGIERRLVIIRPAVVFGPGERGNFTRLATMMRKGFFVYPGRKDTVKSCIYIDDLLFLIETARTMKSRLEVLNGAYPERYTLEDIVSAFKLHHFTRVKLFLLPKWVVLAAVHIFKVFNLFNLGVHPDRVMKLIRSTNVYPLWIKNNNIELPGDIKSALKSWSKNTEGKFD